MKRLTKKQQNIYDNIYVMEDFPTFFYWDFNRKEFEPRSLNKMSTRFLHYLTYELLDYNGEESKLDEYIATKFIAAVRYAYFYNRSYEAEGPNSYSGGHDSIQEQFICWAYGISKEEHRSNKGRYFDEPLQKTEVVKDFIKNSKLLKLAKTIYKPKKK